MTQFSPQPFLIEPSSSFSQKVVNQAVLVEQQRRTRITILFAIIALAPYALREFWSLVRGDFVSVLDLPYGYVVGQMYSAFMSSFASYILLGFGIMLAVYIVGLPRWKKAEFQTIK